jgi:ssRNA-specific RNase YbeY (16S rRNA maturation enzyme)
MKKDLVIFGTGKIAEVVEYYATHECGYNVVAFCVDEKFKESESFLGKPVISFETIEGHYPSSSNDMFVAVGYHDLRGFKQGVFIGVSG